MFRQLCTSAEPEVIGVNNGLYQVDIDEKTLRNNANYGVIETLIGEMDVHKFLENQEHFFQLKIKCLRGKLLKKAKITDIMGFSPFIFGIKHIVSQKFVDCLINEMVGSDEFHLFKIDINDIDGDYYLFFVPMIPSSEIDFSKSLLFPEKDILESNKNYFDINDYGQYSELIKTNLFVRWEKIVLSKKFENKSIINLQGSSELFFSDSLMGEFISQGITNMIIRDKVSLYVE